MEKDIEFLENVTDLFIDNGAKTLTMDEIARQLKISKKTLYQRYKNKEALLEEVLSYNTGKILSEMKKMNESIDNAVERMFARNKDIEKVSESNDSIMIRQLIKYYPHIFTRHMQAFSEDLSEILVQNIEMGRKQGLYRYGFDAYFYSKLFFQLAMSYDNSPYLDTESIPRAQYRQESLLLYLHAITTEKGKEIIKKLQEPIQQDNG